jgi:hypothetical protein
LPRYGKDQNYRDYIQVAPLGIENGHSGKPESDDRKDKQQRNHREQNDKIDKPVFPQQHKNKIYDGENDK